VDVERRQLFAREFTVDPLVLGIIRDVDVNHIAMLATL
jgi:hypothetical protein